MVFPDRAHKQAGGWQILARGPGSQLQIQCGSDPDAAQPSGIRNRIRPNSRFWQSTVELIKNGRWMRIINRALKMANTLGLRVDVTDLKDAKPLWRIRQAENQLFRATRRNACLKLRQWTRNYRYTVCQTCAPMEDLTGIPKFPDMIGKDDFGDIGAKAGHCASRYLPELMNGHGMIGNAK